MIYSDNLEEHLALVKFRATDHQCGIKLIAGEDLQFAN